MNAAPRQTIIPSPVRCTAMLIGVAILCTAFAPVASAQSGWNRAVQAVSITPSAGGAGLWDVNGVLQVHLEDPFSFPLDLSLTVELSVNGTIVASNTHTIDTNPGGSSCVDAAGCGGGCGSGSVDGNPQTLLCVPAGPCNPICDCHCGFLPITSGFPNQSSLQPGDEIMVLLRPAPGALPDSNESDDFQIVTFQDTPVFWDHQITGLELVPSAAGPGMWDIGVEGAVMFNGLAPFADPAVGTVPLGFELQLLVSGIPVHTETFDFAPIPASGYCGCGEICGSINGFPLGCMLSGLGYCNCGWNWLTNIPAIPAVPGDVIEVILRPAPGALPELPGFEDDDAWLEICCGATGIDDSITISGFARLEQNRPNPFDRSTTIGFAAASDTHVTLEVFDVRGRRVRTLVDGTVQGSGAPRSVTWSGRTDDGGHAPSGIYFYRLTTEGRTETRKMVLTR